MAEAHDEKEVRAHDNTHIPIIMAGGASSIPGRTKEESADILMTSLQRAADGHQVLHPTVGQRNEWLNRHFIRSQLHIGKASWTFFKQRYKDEIELDGQQEWVRRKPLAINASADDTDDAQSQELSQSMSTTLLGERQA